MEIESLEERISFTICRDKKLDVNFMMDFESCEYMYHCYLLFVTSCFSIVDFTYVYNAFTVPWTMLAN